MKVAISLRLANDDWARASAWVTEAERLGVDCVWSAEAWGHDAVTPLAFLAARTTKIKLGSGIIQAGTRSPALIAMTAMSLASMSGGRFRLGLGVSGPQVIEGWHGIRFDRPVQRMLGAISGGAAGPWVAGALYDLTGSYTPAFSIAIGGSVLSAFAIWLAAPRKVRAVGAPR